MLNPTTGCDRYLFRARESPTRSPVAPKPCRCRTRSADLIAGAQMWHGLTLARRTEIARVLRPGGVLAIVWSLRDDNEPWLKAMEQVVELPDSYKWFRKNDIPVLINLSVRWTCREFAFTQTSTPEGLVGLVGTFSHVALSDRRDKIEADVRELTQTSRPRWQSLYVRGSVCLQGLHRP